MTLLYFSAQNIDRLVSFYRASLKTGKIFVIDFYTANILGCLQNYGEIPYPSENYANIRVFFPYWLCRRITRQGEQELMYKYKGYKITKKEISDRSGEIMMMVRPSMLKDLEFTKNIEGATFIYSLWEGYLEDDSMQKMMRFTKKNMNFYQVHTSGHAEIATLKKVVKKLKPGKIIPISVAASFSEIENTILCRADYSGMERILILCYLGKLLSLQRMSGRIF